MRYIYVDASAAVTVLESPQVSRLTILIEECTRQTVQMPERFVEPAAGTLDRCKSKRNHIIFGRRGSGKTSLIRKAHADLSLTRTPAAFVDLESFKGHSYPDVLVSVLIRTLREFDKWLDGVAVQPGTKRKWWQKLFGKDARPSQPPINAAEVALVRKSLSEQIEKLKAVLHSTDKAELTTVHRYGAEGQESQVNELSHSRGPEGMRNAGQSRTELAAKQHWSGEEQERSRRSKLEFLHHNILDLQDVLSKIVSLTDSSAYLFLDDLYHIRRSDQAMVIDYFHRLTKGQGVWLKIGTIRHRTEWYRHGDPPFGMKLSDDCDEIDLDTTLEKYSIAKNFLLRVANTLIKEAGLESHSDILVRSAVDRLVLASGGVARDFLTILRRSIQFGLEREGGARGDRVSTEDVNNAAGEHDAPKRDELKLDTFDERDTLERAFEAIKAFCLEIKQNVFLVERDRDTKGSRIIGELVDLRLIHLVLSRVTVGSRVGKIYSAYMLDVSQYTGDRKRRDFLIVPFWKKDGADQLRRVKYIFDPEEAFAELKWSQQGSFDRSAPEHSYS
ncbi:MAG TPA: hypothetical protein VK034_30155 [Enhygromyxa sp.]|nr:hypothetical protein [Enhygromyxa sp.]